MSNEMPKNIAAELRVRAAIEQVKGSFFERAADEIERLRNELAARCGDHGPGAHTAGPVEPFIPEAL